MHVADQYGSDESERPAFRDRSLITGRGGGGLQHGSGGKSSFTTRKRGGSVLALLNGWAQVLR